MRKGGARTVIPGKVAQVSGYREPVPPIPRQFVIDLEEQMGYLYCGGCQSTHREISPEDRKEVLEAYLQGEAQIVTPNGILHRCILDIIGRTNLRNERKRARGLEPLSAGV